MSDQLEEVIEKPKYAPMLSSIPGLREAFDGYRSVIFAGTWDYFIRECPYVNMFLVKVYNISFSFLFEKAYIYARQRMVRSLKAGPSMRWTTVPLCGRCRWSM